LIRDETGAGTAADPDRRQHEVPYFKGAGLSGNAPQLTSTGFETHACTDWRLADSQGWRAAVGAELTIGFLLADMSDSILATMLLLDNFRWDCDCCDPNTVTGCGIKSCRGRVADRGRCRATAT
jgi:hypothetical protein